MQVTHSFYKHLVKHKVTKMRDILFGVQKYIQIEDATRSAANRSPKKSGEGKRPKPQPAAPKKSQNQTYGTINKKPHRNQVKTNREEEFTSFKVFVQHVFAAIKEQEWVRHPRPLPPNPKRPRAGEYCAFHNGMGHQTVDCRYLRKRLQELMNQGYLKEFILDLGQPSEARVQRDVPEASLSKNQATQALIHY